MIEVKGKEKCERALTALKKLSPRDKEAAVYYLEGFLAHARLTRTKKQLEEINGECDATRNNI